MRHLLALTLVTAPCLFASRAFAQSRCDCATDTCASTRAGAATVRGRVSEAEGRDANDRVERYFALSTATPVCAEFEDAETRGDRRAARATTLQLIVTDAALRERIRGLVGRDVTLHGSAFEQMTAHHHTPLLFDVTSIDEAATAPASALTGAQSTALLRALMRARAHATPAGVVSVTDVECIEQGVGAGYDPAISGRAPPPTYTCQGGVTARGATARALHHALAARLEPDCAMGGRCALAARRVVCRRAGGSTRCEVEATERASQ